MAHIIHMSTEMFAPDVVFDKYPEANTLFRTCNLSVNPQFRGRGIASKLIQLSIEVEAYFQ